MEAAERPFYIYCHTAPNGKRYIGQTCLNPERRWNNGHGYDNCTYMHRAIEKYGWDNFKHEILCVVHTRKVANLFEQHYIAKYDTFNEEHGYNLTEGGAGVVGCTWDEERKRERSKRISGEGNPMYGRRHSEESLKKMSENRKGKYVSPEMREFRSNILREANRKRRTPIRQLDMDGNLVAIHDGFGELEKSTGFKHSDIIGVCQGKRDCAYGFRWEYVNEALRKKADDVRKKRSKKGGLTVVQLDMDGNEVARFSSLAEAQRITGFNRNKISACCHGEIDLYRGCQWLFDGRKQIDSNGLGVIQMSLDGKEVARFNSISEASTSTGIAQMRIRQCCRGIQKTTHGYMWKFFDCGVRKSRHDGSKKGVIQFDMDGNELGRYESLMELERLGFNRHVISECCNGVRDSYREYRWRFADKAA